MGRLRAVSRLATAMILVLGCSAGPRGAPSSSPASVALPAAWMPATCYVEDTSASTSDTIRFIDGEAPRPGAPSASINCADGRRRSAPGPIVATLEPPPGVDLRDVLELGIKGLAGSVGPRPDVLVTRDPGVIAYAQRRDEYLVEALPWSATYLFASARPSTVPALPQPAERDALARDVVTTDARGAAEPFAWLTDPTCATAAPDWTVDHPRAGSRPIIAYGAGDATARQLAERIVSLAGAVTAAVWVVEALGSVSRSSMPRAVAMPRDSIAAALADGRARAAVLAVPRDPRTRCGMRDDLHMPAGALPLVDARAHAIVRRGSGAAFLVAADGSLHFVRRAPR